MIDDLHVRESLGHTILQVTAAEQVYQTDITTSSSQEKHYHPKRLLITLNEHPTEEQAQRSAILPEVSSMSAAAPRQVVVKS